MALASAVGVPSANANAATRARLVDVAFDVVNRNTTGIDCPTDGARYTLAGTLALPVGAPPDGVTLYLHGTGNGAPWHFTAQLGHDHIAEMARLSHASVAIDQLGYGNSGIPVGDLVCSPGQADIAGQVARHLRDGTYQSTGRRPRFERVALAVNSQGHIVEVASFSFDDLFDGFIFTGWAPPAFSAAGARLAVQAVRSELRCQVSPQEKWEGAAGGYDFLFDNIDEIRAIAYNTDEKVVDSYAAAFEREPCGVARSIGAVEAASATRLDEVTDPVLIVLGDHDVFVAPELFALRFTGSADVTSTVLGESGHLMMLGRTAPAFRAMLSHWLDDHKL